MVDYQNLNTTILMNNYLLHMKIDTLSGSSEIIWFGSSVGFVS